MWCRNCTRWPEKQLTRQTQQDMNLVYYERILSAKCEMLSALHTLSSSGRRHLSKRRHAAEKTKQQISTAQREMDDALPSDARTMVVRHGARMPKISAHGTGLGVAVSNPRHWFSAENRRSSLRKWQRGCNTNKRTTSEHTINSRIEIISTLNWCRKSTYRDNGTFHW